MHTLDHAGGAYATDRGLPRAAWTVMEGLGLLGVWVLVQVLAGTAFGASQDELAPLMVASMASSAVVLVLVMGYLWAVHARPARVTDLVGLVTPRRGGLRRALRPVLVGAFCYVAVGVGVGLLAGELGVSADDIPAQPLSALIAAEESGPLVVLAYVMAAVAAPVTEEVMFRAVLYLPLRRRLGRWTAAVLVGVVFAAMHDYAWGAPQFFVLSLTFVAVFEATGTLWAPIVVHGCFNGLSVAIMRALDLLG